MKTATRHLSFDTPQRREQVFYREFDGGRPKRMVITAPSGVRGGHETSSGAIGE